MESSNNFNGREKQQFTPPGKNWLSPLVLLAPSGIWLLILLVLPTLIIFELSLVPDIRPGDLVNPSGLDNYFRIFEPIYLKVIVNSLFLATQNWGFGSALSITLILMVSVAIALLIKFGEATEIENFTNNISPQL